MCYYELSFIDIYSQSVFTFISFQWGEIMFRKLLCLIFSLLLVTAAGCGNEQPQQSAPPKQAYAVIKDAAGRQVILEKKPERVVALNPSYLNMIDAVGGTIIGRATSRLAELPESMQNVPEIGFVYNINMESLVGLQPDLVLAGKNQHDKFVPLLESNNIKVIELDAKTYDDVKNTVKMLGDIYGTQQQAEQECALLDKEIKAVTEKLPQEKKRIVIMHATASSVTVEGEKSIAGCVSNILGFENVAYQALTNKNEKTPYSMEALVEQNPEIIFITFMGKTEEIENRLRSDFKNNPAWASLNAVREGKVYVLPEKLFLLNPGLAYPEAVKYMAKQVYPEVFADEQ